MFNSFIGREQELSQLKQLLKKKTASLVVVKRRRRIGKSQLLQEFRKGHKTYFFSGFLLRIKPHYKIN